MNSYHFRPNDGSLLPHSTLCTIGAGGDDGLAETLTLELGLTDLLADLDALLLTLGETLDDGDALLLALGETLELGLTERLGLTDALPVAPPTPRNKRSNGIVYVLPRNFDWPRPLSEHIEIMISQQWNTIYHAVV